MQALGQNKQVAAYFDDISTDYAARYGVQSPYHNYFFRQRLTVAIAEFQFDKKVVVDIGAGTGELYDNLARAFPSVDYFACDISAQMLAHSRIPACRAFVGRTHDIDFPRQQFDFIFSLGVTAYQSPEDLRSDWRFIGDHLAPDGVAVISFTNRSSIDHTLRAVMKLEKPLAGSAVLGQSFSTFAYRSHQVEQMASEVGLRVSRVVFINHTFSPFNTLFPRSSVALAKAIELRAPAMALPLLSSDFIVFAKRV